jgi:hypothetical protein
LKKISIVIFLPLLLFLAVCDNPSDNGGTPGAYIEGSTFIHPGIKFSITYPSTWLMTMDTTVDGKFYDLYAKMPNTDSVVSMITIIKGINTRRTDSIMTAEEEKLKQSLENYTMVSKIGDLLAYNYNVAGVLYIGEKLFTIKGEYLVVISFSIIAYPFTETAIAIRDILLSRKFE